MSTHAIKHLSALFLILLTGCATQIESKVTRFHTLPEVAAHQKYQIVPQESQKGSIEFSIYSGAIAQKLNEYGWELVTNQDAQPDNLVFFAYGIDDGQTVTGSMPLYGQTGGGTSYSYGSVTTGYGSSASYSGTTYTAPTYGVVGSIPYSARLYNRFLRLDILDAKASTGNNPVKVFEGRVRSCGTSSDIALVLPTMIEALFKNFPGPNAKTETINLPMQVKRAGH